MFSINLGLKGKTWNSLHREKNVLLSNLQRKGLWPAQRLCRLP
uniref:Uncharacterized protein n=1 Tax=Anguilla anguilla TaxID=7936 RepID=A0A0E9U6U9_ANGAN